VFSDSQVKLAHSPTEHCFQDIATTELGNEIKPDTSASLGVMLYLESQNNTKYYLRNNIAMGHVLQLVCEDYIDNVSDFLIVFLTVLTYLYS